MPKNPGKHQLRNVLRAFCAAPWSILPGPMEAMLELLNHRAAGQRYTRDEIRQRIGYRERLLTRLPATLALRPGPAGKSAARYPFPVTESGIALITLDGVLAPRMDQMMEISGGTSTLQFASYVRQATADPEIKAIVVPIDSPGGQAVGLEEAAIALRQARDAKPTIVVVMGTIASAAYYIGAAAGEVVAGWDSEVGSIGTVLVHQEFSQADKLEGTTTTVVKAGRYKYVGNSFEPLTAEGRGVLQEEVDAYYAQFVRSLAASLSVSEETVRQRFGQGKMFIASEALKLGMIDRLGSLSDVLAELEAEIAAVATSGRTAKAGLPGGDRQPAALTLNTLTPSQPTFQAQETHPVDPKVFAALVAKGLVAADAKHDDAQPILNAFFAARAQKPPEGAEAIVAALFAPPPAAQAPPPPQQPPAPIGAAAPREATAADRAIEAAAVMAERGRVAEIRARGAVLMQTGVTQEEIDAAIANGTPVERFLRDATARQVEANPPIRPVSGGALIDKFSAAAEHALCARVGVNIEGQAPAGTAELRYRPLSHIAEECLRLAGGRALGTPEDTIREALIAGGLSPVLIRASADTPATGAGSFPWLLSSLANRVLDAGAPMRPYSYKFWCAPMEPLKDFRPVTIIEVGGYSELPEVPDGDDFKEVKGAETAAWIQAGKYGDEVKLTPVMLQNDDLNGFTEQLRDQQRAHEASVNRCCTNVLIGNPTMLDGYSFFGAEHANVVSSSGAAPSDAELDKHEALYGAMTGVGGEGSANYDLNRILVPPALWAGTKRLLKPLVSVLPVTTATAEMWRGEVGYAKEKNLTAASTAVWYTLEDPAFARAFVYAHMIGYQRMRITRYLDPKNQCLVFQVEGRFAAAARNPRGATRDVGA